MKKWILLFFPMVALFWIIASAQTSPRAPLSTEETGGRSGGSTGTVIETSRPTPCPQLAAKEAPPARNWRDRYLALPLHEAQALYNERSKKEADVYKARFQILENTPEEPDLLMNERKQLADAFESELPQDAYRYWRGKTSFTVRDKTFELDGVASVLRERVDTDQPDAISASLFVFVSDPANGDSISVSTYSQAHSMPRHEGDFFGVVLASDYPLLREHLRFFAISVPPFSPRSARFEWLEVGKSDWTTGASFDWTEITADEVVRFYEGNRR